MIADDTPNSLLYQIEAAISTADAVGETLVAALLSHARDALHEHGEQNNRP